MSRNSFINNLVDEGLITNKVVSIFHQMDRGNKSTLKFGSWDQNALKSDTNLTIFRTTSPNSWSLLGDSLKMKKLTFRTRELQIMLSPEFPFIYLPTKYWNKISDYLIKNAAGECHKEQYGGYCKF